MVNFPRVGLHMFITFNKNAHPGAKYILFVASQDADLIRDLTLNPMNSGNLCLTGGLDR